MENFRHKIYTRWADCDPNTHVRHSAYYDYAADTRIRYFAKIGYDARKMKQLGIGPILFKESCSFIKEIQPGAAIIINLLKDGITEDGSRWQLHHELFNEADQKVAHITINGAWMDLNRRKLTKPPIELVKAIQNLKQGEAYFYKKEG